MQSKTLNISMNIFVRKADLPERAWAYIEKLKLKCQKLETSPARGQQHNDLMKDLKIFPLNKKNVVAFVIDEYQQTVMILNIFHGGRDYEAIIAIPRAQH